LKLIWGFWDSKVYDLIKKPKEYKSIRHEMIYLEDRHHEVDILVLPVCQKLWDAGIETYYSCQGGPDSIRIRDGKVYSHRAYVSVKEVDAEKVCAILADRNPRIDINPRRVHADRCAVRFDPFHIPQKESPGG
jgi:hypothetical protein